MATEILRPDATGDENTIVYSVPSIPGADHWQNVDETPPDDNTSYVQAYYQTWRRDLYNIPNSGVGAGTINHITVYVRCLADVEPDQTSVKIAIKSTNVHESSEKQLAERLVWENFSNQWATNPDNAHAWTWDEINSLQIGVALRACLSTNGYTRCTQVYVVVDYTVAAVGRSFGFIIG